jgi:nucleotide-binding universal stress UspA family protein
MPRIYVSYRRSESATMGGRIAEELRRVFDRQDVATDLDQSESGANFARHVQTAMAAYDVVLVVMGKRWATDRNNYGFSKLFDPNDHVRLEVEAALNDNHEVIPVLLNDAVMPPQANLPASLADLATKTPIVVSDGVDFSADMRRLIQVIRQLSSEASEPGFLPDSHHVFLSYSRKDTPVMERLRDDLRAAGLTAWVDDSLEPGTSAWERSISAAIRGAGCLIVILSPDAEQSVWVGRELAMAETLDKRIFPILARGTEKDAIPFRLMSHQWVDGRHNYQEAFGKLLAAVNKYLNLT